MNNISRLIATIRRNLQPIMWACLAANVILGLLNASMLAYQLAGKLTTIGLIANVLGILAIASGLWLWRVKE